MWEIARKLPGTIWLSQRRHARPESSLVGNEVQEGEQQDGDGLAEVDQVPEFAVAENVLRPGHVPEDGRGV